MTIKTTVAQARLNLDQLCDRPARGETVIIQKPGAEDVAMISAAEWSSLMETMHLIRSPANAIRLIAALERTKGTHSMKE